MFSMGMIANLPLQFRCREGFLLPPGFLHRLRHPPRYSRNPSASGSNPREV